MIKQKSKLELAMAGITPFLGIVSVGLIQFVSFGFQTPDGNWYWQMAVNVLAMVCFWLPGRIISVQKAKDSEKTKAVEGAYLDQVDKVYEKGKIIVLRGWCERYTQLAKERFVRTRVEMSGVKLDDYNTKYKSNNKAINRCKELSRRQKKHLKSANNFDKIKPLCVERLLPNLTVNSEYDLCVETYDKASRSLAVRKLLTSCILGVAVGAVIVTPNESINVVAMITPMLLKLFTGAMHFMLGLTSGKMLIDKHYIGDLSLKTERLQEFIADQMHEGNANHTS